jgi:ankyrin repeat protein
VDVNRVNLGGWTPLMYASSLGRDTVVNLLLDDLALDVNRCGPDGCSALMRACAAAHESVVYFLMQVK